MLPLTRLAWSHVLEKPFTHTAGGPVPVGVRSTGGLRWWPSLVPGFDDNCSRDLLDALAKDPHGVLREYVLEGNSGDVRERGVSRDAEALWGHLERLAEDDDEALDESGTYSLYAAYSCPGLGNDPKRVDRALEWLFPAFELVLLADSAILAGWSEALGLGVKPSPRATCTMLCGGDRRAADLLEQILYWSSRGWDRKPVGPEGAQVAGPRGVYKTAEEWCAECALTAHPYKSALAKLKQRGLVAWDVSYRGNTRITWLRPNFRIAPLDAEKLGRFAGAWFRKKGHQEHGAARASRRARAAG